MELYKFDDIKKIFCVGSVNGHFNKLFQYIRMKTTKKSHSHYVPLNDSIIFVCGDCGFDINNARQKEILNNLNSFCNSNNIHIICIRGNHDDPFYFSNKSINLSNIKTIPDYSIVKTNTDIILCIGGGISSDRTWRLEQENIINQYKEKNHKKLYWENEAINFDEKEINTIIESGLEINTIISHTSPISAFPLMKVMKPYVDYWSEDDKTLKDDIINDRTKLEKIFSLLKKRNLSIEKWIFGHYKTYKKEKKENTNFISLDGEMSILYINDINKEEDQNIPYIKLPEDYFVSCTITHA